MLFASRLRLVLFLQILAAIWHCGQAQNACMHRVRSCNPSEDYFDVKLSFRHAQFVQFSYFNTYMLVNITAPRSPSVYYVLVRCGCPAPVLPAGLSSSMYSEIHIPVASVASTQTASFGALMLLGQRSKIVAIDATFISNVELFHDVREGTVADLSVGISSTGGSILNYTRLLDTNFVPTGVPGAIWTSSGPISTPSWVANQAVLERQRVQELAWRETTALGRAEHIKIVGVIAGAAISADALFTSIEESYMESKAIAAQAKRRPSVMRGMPSVFSPGSWPVPAGGNNWFTSLIRDAGAVFANDDDSLPSALPYESFVNTFSHAHIWIDQSHSSPTQVTPDSIMLANITRLPGGDASLYPRLMAFRCGTMFSYDNQLHNRSVGNPFWEEGPLRPDLMLRDLVYLLHPDVPRVQPPHFFRKLPPLSDASVISRYGGCPYLALPATPRGPNEIYAARQFVVLGFKPSLFNDYIYRVIKPALSAFFNKPQSEFEMYITTAPVPTQLNPSNSVPAFFARVNANFFTQAEANGFASVLNSDAFVAEFKAQVMQSAAQSAQGTVAVQEEQQTLLITSDGSELAFTVPTQKDSNLSPGAIAGIVVGCLVGFALAMALVGYCCFRTGHERAYKAMSSGKPLTQELASSSGPGATSTV